MLNSVKVFIGCPHRTLSLVSLTDDLATLIYNARDAPKFGLLEAARLCACAVVDASYLFLESNVPLRVQMVSVFSRNLDCVGRVSRHTLKSFFLFFLFRLVIYSSTSASRGGPHGYGKQKKPLIWLGCVLIPARSSTSLRPRSTSVAKLASDCRVLIARYSAATPGSKPTSCSRRHSDFLDKVNGPLFFVFLLSSVPSPKGKATD